MKTTIKLLSGGFIVVRPMPFGKEVHVACHSATVGCMQQMVIPAELAGVFAQAVEGAATAVEQKSSGLRCLDGNACKAGQVPCPKGYLCGLSQAL